jgi:hypothetical protein
MENWKQKGDDMGLRSPFTYEVYREQRNIIKDIQRRIREQEPKELTGKEFIIFCNSYNERIKDESKTRP